MNAKKLQAAIDRLTQQTSSVAILNALADSLWARGDSLLKQDETATEGMKMQADAADVSAAADRLDERQQDGARRTVFLKISQ